jgi:energy-converting hydrogenase Eha subunit A
MIKTFGPSWIPRIILGLISLVIFIFGAATLFGGEENFYSSWGGIVFAPVAIIIGLLGLIITAFKQKVFAPPPKKKSRFRGWPGGRSRY